MQTRSLVRLTERGNRRNPSPHICSTLIIQDNPRKPREIPVSSGVTLCINPWCFNSPADPYLCYTGNSRKLVGHPLAYYNGFVRYEIAPRHPTLVFDLANDWEQSPELAMRWLFTYAIDRLEGPKGTRQQILRAMRCITAFRVSFYCFSTQAPQCGIAYIRSAYCFSPRAARALLQDPFVETHVTKGEPFVLDRSNGSRISYAMEDLLNKVRRSNWADIRFPAKNKEQN